MWALRPEGIERSSLPEALRRLAERWSQESGTVASVTVTSTPHSLTPEIKVTLLRGLIDRDLSGVRLVVSDDYDGIKAAVAGELPGTEWQRCTVHFERNVLSHVPSSEMSKVAEDLSAIFKVRREKTARALAKEFVSLYQKSYPKAVSVFEAGIDDALIYLRYPGSHHSRLRTTNMLEQLFKEVKSRTRVVGVFPNEVSASTLATEIALRSTEHSGR